MADPTSYVPHLMGITLDTQGVTYTQVVAINRTTGERQIKAVDANKNVIFDAADFTSGYSADDVIEFNNVGASKGQTTITINSATGGFQSEEMDCAASPTVAINL